MKPAKKYRFHFSKKFQKKGVNQMYQAQLDSCSEERMPNLCIKGKTVESNLLLLQDQVNLGIHVTDVHLMVSIDVGHGIHRS